MIALQCFTDYVKCHFFFLLFFFPEFSILFLVLMASKGSSVILQNPVTKSNFLVEKSDLFQACEFYFCFRVSDE